MIKSSLIKGIRAQRSTMVDGVTTQIQKEVGLLHKELKAVCLELTSANEQLWKDIKARFEGKDLEASVLLICDIRESTELLGRSRETLQLSLKSPAVALAVYKELWSTLRGELRSLHS